MIGVLLIAFLTGSSCSRPVTPAPPVTTVATVILVRHAEKVLTDPKDKNALLTPAGEARARELVHVLGDAGITSIFATQVTRTQQTAKPIADKLGLPVTQVEATNTVELVKQIKAKPVGSVTLVVGHTNSIPEVITALGAGTIPIIPETEYDHLFVVTVDSSGKATLAKLRYGTATP
jgi:broad specificity phosphatase PhoE